MATAVIVAACSTSDVTAPPPAIAGTFSVDASAGWVYFNLADSAIVNVGPSARESGAWDIAFNATNVMLNGGQAGPGGVLGSCICQNSLKKPTNAEWLAMTPSGMKPPFDSIRGTPAEAAFVSDRLTPAIGGFYNGNGANAAVNADSVYFVRYSDSTGFAKVHAISIASQSTASPGRVTIEYALAGNGDAAFGPARSVVIDATGGTRYLDLNSGLVTASASSSWELEFDGYAVRVNGGASGTGKAAATSIPGETFEAATPASTNANAYRTDVYAGVFAASRFYKYNLDGQSTISPTFDIYLIRRGTRTYKLQIINYYSATGISRHITFRYALLEG